MIGKDYSCLSTIENTGYSWERVEPHISTRRSIYIRSGIKRRKGEGSPKRPHALTLNIS